MIRKESSEVGIKSPGCGEVICTFTLRDAEIEQESKKKRERKQMVGRAEISFGSDQADMHITVRNLNPSDWERKQISHTEYSN